MGKTRIAQYQIDIYFIPVEKIGQQRLGGLQVDRVGARQADAILTNVLQGFEEFAVSQTNTNIIFKTKGFTLAFKYFEYADGRFTVPECSKENTQSVQIRLDSCKFKLEDSYGLFDKILQCCLSTEKRQLPKLNKAIVEQLEELYPGKEINLEIPSVKITVSPKRDVQATKVDEVKTPTSARKLGF